MILAFWLKRSRSLAGGCIELTSAASDGPGVENDPSDVWGTDWVDGAPSAVEVRVDWLLSGEIVVYKPVTLDLVDRAAPTERCGRIVR